MPKRTKKPEKLQLIAIDIQDTDRDVSVCPEIDEDGTMWIVMALKNAVRLYISPDAMHRLIEELTEAQAEVVQSR